MIQPWSSGQIVVTTMFCELFIILSGLVYDLFFVPLGLSPDSRNLPLSELERRINAINACNQTAQSFWGTLTFASDAYNWTRKNVIISVGSTKSIFSYWESSKSYYVHEWTGPVGRMDILQSMVRHGVPVHIRKAVIRRLEEVGTLVCEEFAISWDLVSLG